MRRTSLKPPAELLAIEDKARDQAVVSVSDDLAERIDRSPKEILVLAANRKYQLAREARRQGVTAAEGNLLMEAGELAFKAAPYFHPKVAMVQPAPLTMPRLDEMTLDQLRELREQLVELSAEDYREVDEEAAQGEGDAP